MVLKSHAFPAFDHQRPLVSSHLGVADASLTEVTVLLSFKAAALESKMNPFSLKLNQMKYEIIRNSHSKPWSNVLDPAGRHFQSLPKLEMTWFPLITPFKQTVD